MSEVKLALIAAMARNRVIGRDNAMPWHLPEDLRYFKATTLGKPIVMGRKTFDSLGRPLPGRTNIVVSRQPDLRLEGAQVFASIDAALDAARQQAQADGVDEVMVIGGDNLYRQTLESADRIYHNMREGVKQSVAVAGQCQVRFDPLETSGGTDTAEEPPLGVINICILDHAVFCQPGQHS